MKFRKKQILQARRLPLTAMTLLPLLGFQAALAQDMDATEFAGVALAALSDSPVQGIEITANGWDACLGQAWHVSDGWARWELTGYSRTFDYVNGATSHSANRRAGMDPGRIGGCGAQPDAAPTPQQSYADATSAWGDQLLMSLSPHGFLDRMQTADPEIVRDANGWQVSFEIEHSGTTYMMEGSFNAGFQLETATTWMDDSVFGDMQVQADYGEYADFGEVSWPSSMTLEQGGFPQLHLEITAAIPKEERLDPPAPRAGRPPAGTTAPAYSDLGNGVFVINGQYQAVIVEFDTFSVVLDGLQSDARVQEIRSMLAEIVPGKPVRYVLSTHSHFDHASGLRQFAADGATIITHQSNMEFFEAALSRPRTLGQNTNEPERVDPVIQGVDGSFVIEDGSGQVVEIHALGPSLHAADMLIAYLPATGTVIEADVLQPWINPVFAGTNGPHPLLVYFHDELETLGLDYRDFIPIHVPPNPPMMTRADLEAVLSGTGQ